MSECSYFIREPTDEGDPWECVESCPRGKWVQYEEKFICVESCDGLGLESQLKDEDEYECVESCPETHMWDPSVEKCVEITDAPYYFSHVLGCFTALSGDQVTLPLVLFVRDAESGAARVQESCADMGWTHWTVVAIDPDENTDTDIDTKLDADTNLDSDSDTDSGVNIDIDIDLSIFADFIFFCIPQCDTSALLLFGQCVATCPTNSQLEQLSYGDECFVGRKGICEQDAELKIGVRVFCTSDCGHSTVIALGVGGDAGARVSCLEGVPENARSWAQDVWVSGSCAAFAARCDELRADRWFCRFGENNDFAYPYDFARACVDVGEQNCAYLISEVEKTCGPRCPHFLWRFGGWRVGNSGERWRVCVSACAVAEVQLVLSSEDHGGREESRQCTLCLSENALSEEKQFLHPAEGSGRAVCNNVQCQYASGVLRFAQIVHLGASSVTGEQEEQRLCAEDCDSAGQFQGAEDQYMCVEKCEPFLYYQKTEIGPRCLAKCDQMVSEDPAQVRQDAKLCTDSCEGEYDFLFTDSSNQQYCYSACPYYYEVVDGKKRCTRSCTGKLLEQPRTTGTSDWKCVPVCPDDALFSYNLQGTWN